eukprot:2616968-Prymnesium_polylepis.1
MAQVCGTFNLPPVRGTTYAHADDRLTEAVGIVAARSRAAACQEERLRGFRAGHAINEAGDVETVCEEDTCWPKRASGKAYNS